MRFYLTSPSLYIISFAGGRLKAAPQSESDRKIKARESTAELKQNLNITDKKILEQVYSIHLEAYRQLAEIEYLQQKDRRAYASRLWEIETWRYRLIGHLLDMKHISPIEQYMHNTWQKN